MAIGVLIAVLTVCAQGSASAAKKSKKKLGAISCSHTRTVAVDDATRKRAAKAVLCLINRQRRAHGVRLVRPSKPLEAAASKHSLAMVLGHFLSHSSPGGDSARMRVLTAGYAKRSRKWLVGETLTWGSGPYATPAQLVAALMKHTPHRRTVLDRRFRDVGIGMALGAPIREVEMASATVTVAFGRR